MPSIRNHICRCHTSPYRPPVIKILHIIVLFFLFRWKTILVSRCFLSTVLSPEHWYAFCEETQSVQFYGGNGTSTSYSLQTLELIWISLLIHTLSLLPPLCSTCFPFLLKSYNELMTEDFPIHGPCNFFPSQGTA